MPGHTALVSRELALEQSFLPVKYMLSVDVCKVQHCVRLWTQNYFLLIMCREQTALFIAVTCSLGAAG